MLLLTLISLATAKLDDCSKLALTPSSTSSDDVAGKCREELGQEWDTAEWTSVKSMEGLEACLDTLKIPVTSNEKQYYVTNEGKELYAGWRHYFVERHNQDASGGYWPNNWLVHDKAQNHLLTLGSWTGTGQVLCELKEQDCDNIDWTNKGRCGPQYGGQVCNGQPDGKGNIWQWCSDYGWCGDTDLHNAGNKAYDFPEACEEAPDTECDKIDWTKEGRCGPYYGGQVCNGKPDGKGNIWQWCSDYGWCGNTPEHNAGHTAYDFPERCDCDNIEWTKGGRCGPDYGDQVCNGQPDGKGNTWQWCSNFGWCGDTDLHNAGNTKYDFPERCDDVPTDCAYIDWTEAGRCGPNYGDQVCNGQPDGKGNTWQWCSDWGWCGDTDLHKAGNTKYDFPERCDCDNIEWTKAGRCGPDYGDQVCNGQPDGKGNTWQWCSNYGWCGDTDLHNAGNTAYDFPDRCEGHTGDSSDGCAYVVTWHVKDHAQGELYVSLSKATEKYQELKSEGLWATRLYDPSGAILEQYGAMPESMWKQLKRWRKMNACIDDTAKSVATIMPSPMPSEMPIDISTGECDNINWTKEARCGPNYGGQVCNAKHGKWLYCSNWGWCGHSDSWNNGNTAYDFPEKCSALLETQCKKIKWSDTRRCGPHHGVCNGKGGKRLYCSDLGFCEDASVWNDDDAPYDFPEKCRDFVDTGKPVMTSKPSSQPSAMPTAVPSFEPSSMPSTPPTATAIPTPLPTAERKEVPIMRIKDGFSHYEGCCGGRALTARFSVDGCGTKCCRERCQRADSCTGFQVRRSVSKKGKKKVVCELYVASLKPSKVKPTCKANRTKRNKQAVCGIKL